MLLKSVDAAVIVFGHSWKSKKAMSGVVHGCSAFGDSSIYVSTSSDRDDKPESFSCCIACLEHVDCRICTLVRNVLFSSTTTIRGHGLESRRAYWTGTTTSNQRQRTTSVVKRRKDGAYH